MRQPPADRSATLVGLVVGALAPLVVALLLVPFRTELDNANVALVLVLVVVIAAIIGGRRAGALAAIVATASFDFFLTEPYLSLKVEGSDDLETVLILLGVALLVGPVASRGRQSQRGRERAGEAISRVHRVADQIARGTPVDEMITSVSGELRELLGLQDVPLEIVRTPTGEVTASTLLYIDELEQAALIIRGRLLFRKTTAVTSIPYRVDTSRVASPPSG